ncbi:MAG: 2-amino-4-hydroxy-6-hydroxymethyldihydropteridine diphosphokinase [Bacteroidales bacterium]|nr:2-amino-4-hydroxy-6-hydroxymethyldihydropteridine diphosphokinase [Bacteroidales bacterium]
MTSVDLYLGLGSNLGEREVNLMRAVTMMDEAFGVTPERISKVYEMPSWGFEGPAFLNMCILYRIPVETPSVEHVTELFHKMKEIEKALGRDDVPPEYDSEGKRVYHNRTIDIDILYYGNEIINTEELTIPHPLIEQRDFVKKPLKEIYKH